jgi:hypothetical protein
MRASKKAFLSITSSLALSGAAFATPIIVDGIYTPGEYDGAISGSKTLLWYNTHESIYTASAGNTNPLLWEINSLSGGKWSLNLFFEVPDYARRMIWRSGVDYDGSNFDAAWGIPKEYLDAYLEGAKNADPLDPLNKSKWHHDSVKMDYNTQTSSEYFQLNTVNFQKLIEVDWQAVDGDGLTNGVTWKTSREYLIANGLATTSLSLNFDTTASIELMWNNFASQALAQSYVDSITSMELHLSDEARGISSKVPEPGSTLPLLGAALLGMAAVRRCTLFLQVKA